MRANPIADDPGGVYEEAIVRVQNLADERRSVNELTVVSQPL